MTPDYCRMMARYNAWQNKQMKAALEALDHETLTQDRGAFFGSILKTANHILWGDLIWMAKFDGGEPPSVGIPGSVDLNPTLAAWSADRFRADARILNWARRVQTVELLGEMRWYSGAMGTNVAVPTPQCVTHFFNHQTHHRGQIHAMVTAAGGTGWNTDLVFMPKDGPWL